MGLTLYNTLTRSLQPFSPQPPEGKQVRLYCCGPTVYDFAHIGNWRTFVFSDLVRRYLEFKGYAVNHVMNITDVDDKIIKRVRESGSPLPEFTARYEAAWLEDLRTLNCLRPTHTPRATEHIADIIQLVRRLEEQGFAYKTADGSVYFAVGKYRQSGRHYGQLLHLNFDEMRAGQRVRSDEYQKEAVADFALWKARVPEDGDVFWPSPWGEGRPGWHIECSAMSMKLLGPSFDLHLGGEDLVFPHHEDEIAQSEGSGWQNPGEPFVRFWLHGAHLLVEGKKMSKSLGNFFTLRDLLAKGFSGREIRFLLLSAHYRETFNFTLSGLETARASLARIDDCLARLREAAGPAAGPATGNLKRSFESALDNDLNVSGGWAAVFDWVRDLNRRMSQGPLPSAEAAGFLADWEQVDPVLGVGKKETWDVPAEIQALFDDRQQARRARDFQRSDAIRDELKSKGWLVEDTLKGARLKKLQS